MIQVETERRQTTAIITQTSTNIVIAVFQETDTTVIAQFLANPTSVTIATLIQMGIVDCIHRSRKTIVPEMTLIPIANHRRHTLTIVSNLVRHPFIDTTLDLLIVVVRIMIAIELRLKIANPTPEITTNTIAVMSPCLQMPPLLHQFLLKILMSATNAPSFKFK